MKFYETLDDNSTPGDLLIKFGFREDQLPWPTEFNDIAENIPSVKSLVNFVINHGWNLVGVSFRGGCRSTGIHIYHFVSD